MIRELSTASGLVLATGGGAVVREENRQLLAGMGYVVYLQTSVREQLVRTRRDRKRPLLQNTDREKVLSDLLLARDPLYREVADFIVQTDRRGSSAVCAEILRQLDLDTEG